MVEINLLRWHQTDAKNSQKKLKIIFLILLMGVVLIVHYILRYKNQTADLEINQLTTTLSSHEIDRSDNSFSEMDQLSISQKKFSQLIGLLDCLAEHRVQMTEVIFQKNQIHLVGMSESVGDWTKTESVCLANKASLLIKKMQFNHKNKMDYLLFSLDVI